MTFRFLRTLGLPRTWLRELDPKVLSTSGSRRDEILTARRTLNRGGRFLVCLAPNDDER